jgi:hypothetical protein
MERKFIKLIERGELTKIKTYLKNNPTVELSAIVKWPFDCACQFNDFRTNNMVR